MANDTATTTTSTAPNNTDNQQDMKKTKTSFPPYAMVLAAIVLAISILLVKTTTSNDAISSTTPEGFRADPATGFAFPLEQDFATAGKKLQLLGVGTRKKAILNVYSVALYAGKPLATKLQAAGSSKCEALLANTKGAVVAAQLTFNMGLNAEKMAEALTNIAGVAQATKDAFGAMILEGIDGKLTKREQMTLEWGKDGQTVAVTARGQALGQVRDADLYQGLLKVYLGPNSVSPALKQDIEAYMGAAAK